MNDRSSLNVMRLFSVKQFLQRVGQSIYMSERLHCGSARSFPGYLGLGIQGQFVIRLIISLYHVVCDDDEGDILV